MSFEKYFQKMYPIKKI